MKVNDFMSKLNEMTQTRNLYEYGKFLNKRKNAYLLSDCSGMIKGILWGYPYNGIYKSKGVPDVDADTMIRMCSNVSSDFSNVKIGEMVWMVNHCGIYAGNGKVIESTPKWENGIQYTHLKQRNWLKHGFLPWIDYSTDATNNITNDLSLAINTIAHYVIKGTYGNGIENRKKGIYKDVKALVNGLSISRESMLKNALCCVANEVWKGTFGNGEDKRANKIIDLVQSEVNRII